MNALMGKKISIVSPKVQTTYHGVRGILNREGEQLVLTDTPGFQGHSEPVAKLLNKVAESNAKDCDILAWVFDASSPRLMGQLKKLEMKIRIKPPEKSICVLNKVDKCAKPALLPLIDEISKLGLFSEIVPISALKSSGVDRLADLLRGKAPEGQPMYPTDMETDRPKEFLISELIREKIYRDTHQEVPYSARVEIEEPSAEESEARVPTVRAVIHVDSQSRRGILIGKGGAMLKKIGTEARAEIEKLLGRHICLKLHVDVQDDWKRDSRVLSKYLELQ
jgi:GTP-binding protein Era